MPRMFSKQLLCSIYACCFLTIGCEDLDKVLSTDNTAPTVVIISPANNSTLTGSTEIKIDATDDVGVKMIEYLVDGAIVAIDSTLPFEFTWDPGFWANDDYHTVMVKAYDAKLNVGRSNIVTVMIPTSLSIAPTIVSPIPHSFIDSDAVKIIWTKTRSAKGYDLDIAYDEDFNNIAFSVRSIADTSITTSSLPRYEYFLRIRAINSFDVKTSWSSPVIFYTSVIRSFSEVFGGTGSDRAMYAIQLQDGNHLICGSTSSYGLGAGDGWLIKTNSAGKQLWNRTYGGASHDRINFVAEINSGGYLLGGYTSSKGQGGEDAFLIKTDTSGNILWERTFGGNGDDAILSICHATDGTIYTTGYSSSYPGGYQAWIIKTDLYGNELWKKTYGGIGADFGHHIKEVNGGFAVSGVNGSVQGNGYDFWLFKIDSEGKLLWDKTFGTSADERAIKFTPTSDGGMAVTGYTTVSGNMDVWLVKTNSDGVLIWEKRFGATGDDFGMMVTTTAFSGLAISGYTTNNNDQNAWLIRTDPNGNELWNKKFGGTGSESAVSVQETSDRGLLLGCTTSSVSSGTDDFWLIKTDLTGNIK